jgi:hypothetical protein
MERAGGCRQSWLDSLRMQLAELPSCLDAFHVAYSVSDLEKMELEVLFGHTVDDSWAGHFLRV